MADQEGVVEITDNELAEAFLKANEESKNDNKNEIIDIYQEKQQQYIYSSNEPSEELKDTLKKTVDFSKTMNAEKLMKNNRDLRRRFCAFLNLNSIEGEKHTLLTPDWIFYEKFKKQKKERKQKYLSDFMTFTDIVINNLAYLKRILYYEFAFLFLGISLFAFLQVQAYGILLPAMKNPTNPTFVNAIQSTSMALNGLALFILLIPYILWSVLWFINVNNFHKMKLFHYLTWITITISFLIFFSVLIILLIHIFFFA